MKYFEALVCHRTQLVRNYANTLLNKSHDVGAYIRHGSISNIFDSLSGEEVTLGVAALSQQNDHFMSSIGTNHPFKNILLLTYDSTDVETQTIPAPGGDVTLSVEASEQSPMMGLCEVAAKVKTPWFAVTTNYHIINAPVSVLMHMGQPVLPYLLASSSYCMDRPDCKASLEQAEELFGIKLNYHHDVTEVLFNTTETESFCAAWTLAAGDKSLEDCQLVSGPSADDFMAWKLSLGMSITGTARERTRYGWRSWTTLWEPLPVDTRNCSVYGFEEYADTLAYISNCSLNVENASACNANGACRWEPMFETGVCLPDRPGLSTTVNITVPRPTGELFNFLGLPFP
ncbi:unnamed protein product [Symbiodinium microadriaticum]|nr:unnamed protein product [Symbiodinium microadriaticum]